MIRLAVVLFVIVFGFVLPPATQDFKLPGIPGRVYFKNLRIQNLSLLSGGPDGRKMLLTGRARSGRLHLQRIGPFERVRDDGGPRGGRDAPGSVLDELRGKAQRAVESPPFFTPADEALQLSPSELLDVTRAHLSTPERPPAAHRPPRGERSRDVEASGRQPGGRAPRIPVQDLTCPRAPRYGGC